MHLDLLPPALVLCGTVLAAQSPAEKTVAANEGRDFAHRAEGAVLLGTDPAERWPTQEYNLSVPIPNALMKAIRDQIEASKKP